MSEPTANPTDLLTSLPEPEDVRRLLAQNLREGRLLRQLLRTSERAADLRNWADDGDTGDVEETPAMESTSEHKETRRDPQYK